MPPSQNDGPQPACVEDYDDDKNTVLSATRVHARAGKDGSDSGYSSRTGTVDGEHPESGPMADMKSRAVQIERDRMPYSGGHAVQRRESINHPRPVRSKAPEPAQPAKDVKKKFCHQPGLCWTCDQVGYHVTQEEVDEIKRRLARAKPSTTENPKAARQPPTNQAKEREVDIKLPVRRMSSYRERPDTQYPPPAMQPMSASYATPQPYYSTGYASPLPTAGYPSQPSFAYPTFPQTPTTPGTATYVAQPVQQEYFPKHVPEIGPPRLSRRVSAYNDHDPRRPLHEYNESTRPQREPTQPREIVDPRRDTRSQAPQHTLSRSIDRDAYEQDRRRMPPPELPIERSEHTRRPSVKKYPTYNDNGPTMSYAGDMSREVVDQTLEKRRSREHRDHNQLNNREPLSVRTHDLAQLESSASRRRLPEEPSTRPAARKSVSYSHPSEVQTVAKSSVPREITQRRVTTPVTSLDAKVAEAEAYQQKRSSMTSDDFSAEKLKSVKSSKAPTRSDAGSNYSHRESHYSSSKDSTAAKKARRDSIVIETGSKNRPLSIQMPNGLTVQIGPDHEKVRDNEKRKEQKLLEHEPASASSVSQTPASRSRAATSSHASSDRGRDQEYQEKTSKRLSHVKDSRPPPSPVKTSTKSSRAPSRSRASSDADGSRRRRQSVVSERIVLRN